MEPIWEEKHEINGKEISRFLPVPYWLTLTEQHKNLIQEFREQAQDYVRPEHTDYYLSRFLMARKWDLSLSIDFFVKAMTLRAAEDMDNILETHPQSYWYNFLCSYWPTSIQTNRFHSTKDGCPVMYESIGMQFVLSLKLLPTIRSCSSEIN
jgi:hypothetical protein